MVNLEHTTPSAGQQSTGNQDTLSFTSESEEYLTLAVQCAFRQAVAAGGSPITKLEPVRNFATQIQDRVASILADELCGYNQSYARTAHLPDEILCSIWSFLPVKDCVAVARVCSDWRSLALGTSSLWTDLELKSSQHAHECSCDVCSIRSLGLAEPVTCGRCKTRLQLGSNNARFVRHLLPRSGVLPLTLEVTLVAEGDRQLRLTAVADLADALAPHAARIQRLTGTGSLDGFQNLFYEIALGPLSGLQYLDLTYSRNAYGDAEYLEINGMPHLVTLKIQGEMFVDWQTCSGTNMERVHCSFNTPSAIVDCLRRCPSLRSLHAVLYWGYKYRTSPSMDAFHLREARALADKLTSVTVSRVSEEDVPHVLALFHLSTRPYFALEVESPANSGFMIFSDLQEDTHLSYPRLHTITGTDHLQVTRAIHFSNGYRGSVLWQHLNPGNVVELTICEGELWEFASRTSFPTPLPGLRSLNLYISANSQGFDNIVKEFVRATDPTDPHPLFPSISSIRLSARRWELTAPVQLYTGSLVKLIGLLTHAGNPKLQVLTLEGIGTFGDREPLMSVVETIVMRELNEFL